jgi:membrane protein YqaA with SNARE-associated domain
VTIKFSDKYYKILALTFSILLSILIFVFRDKFSGLQGYGLLGLFILSVIGNATIILPAPVVFSAFVAGAVFDPFAVAVVVALGATIGEMTGYLAGYGSEDIIEKNLRLQRVKKWIDRYGLLVIFALAAIPNPLFDLAGIIAGATEISVKKYLAIVFLGKMIKFGVFAYLGAHSVVILDRFI